MKINPIQAPLAELHIKAIIIVIIPGMYIFFFSKIKNMMVIIKHIPIISPKKIGWEHVAGNDVGYSAFRDSVGVRRVKEVQAGGVEHDALGGDDNDIR